jgi:hypothetical protein
MCGGRVKLARSGEATAPPTAENWCLNGPNSGPPARNGEPMFTPYQCQDSARTVGRVFRMNHSRVVSRAMNAYHSRAVVTAGRA